MLEQRCAELVRAAEAQDADAVLAGIGPLWEAAHRAGPEQVDRVLPGICELFDVLPLGISGRLAVAGGAMVEDGADPAPLVEPVLAGLEASLTVAAEFLAAWPQVVGGRRKVPEPVDEQDVADAVLDALTGRAGWRRLWRGAAGLPAEEAYRLAEGWFAAAQWALAATTLLQHRTVRVGRPSRGDLIAAVAAMAPHRSDLQCLAGLLAVLDDERLVVLHRPTGRGFEVSVSGVGDNFQLHTLLAAVLSGVPADGLLAGVRPDPHWVAAATDGPIKPPSLIRGQFNLVDGFGQWIWNEGRPADIPLLDGRRVVILDLPPYERTWGVGRAYPRMHAEVRLDRTMPDDEAAGWLSRVAPARWPGRGDPVTGR